MGESESMKTINLRQFDVVTVNGEGLISRLIKWRSLSIWSHTFMIESELGSIYDITANGVHIDDLSYYEGSWIAICRHKQLNDVTKIEQWCKSTMLNSKGYDFLGLLGFVLYKPSTEDSERWFCSEFVYNAFQLNGYKLTNKYTKFPYPSLFYSNVMFDIIAEGVLGKDFIT